MGGVSCPTGGREEEGGGRQHLHHFLHAFSVAAALMRSHSRVSTVRRQGGSHPVRARTLGADMETSACGRRMHQREVHRATLTSH